MKSAKRVSSNPATDKSSGTLIPSSNAGLITPMAFISLEQSKAVGCSRSRPAPLEKALHDRHYLRKHGKKAYYGQARIKE